MKQVKIISKTRSLGNNVPVFHIGWLLGIQKIVSRLTETTALNNLSLRVKLLAACLAIGIIPLTIIGYFAVTTSNQALSRLAFEKLENMREVKKAQIESFFQEHRRNTGALLESVTVLKQAAFSQMRSVQDVQQMQVQETVGSVINLLIVIGGAGSLCQFSGEATSPLHAYQLM